MPLLMSVNLAARQVREPGLVADVAQILADTGWPAELLQLELTESAFMGTDRGHPWPCCASSPTSACASPSTTSAPATPTWPTCAACRCTPSSWPDRSSPAAAAASDETDDVDLEIVAAVVRLAHILGLTVTAEAVETADAARPGCADWAATPGRAGTSPRPRPRAHTRANPTTALVAMTPPAAKPGNERKTLRGAGEAQPPAQCARSLP